jgi:hypothetical protein
MLRVLSLRGYVRMQNTADGPRKTTSICAMS